MPETKIQPGSLNPRALELVRQSFWDASVDNFTKPPAQNPDAFETLKDVEPVVDNRLNRRRGYTLLSNPVTAARRMFETHFSTTGGTRNRIILTAADGSGADTKDNNITVINENGDLLTDLFNPSSSATAHPYIALSREFAYILDGASADQKKWDGDEALTAGSLTNWGASASGAVFAAATGAGDITGVEVGRRYKVAFLYTPTGHAWLYDITSGGTNEEHTTDSVDSGPLDSNDVDLSSIPTFTVGTTGLVSASIHRVILAASDGGPLDTLYEVGRITDNTTTTFRDNVTENALLASPVWSELGDDGREYGIYDNTPPSTTIPTATIVVPHRDRLVALTEQFLFWSKSLNDLTTSTGQITGRYEECWPSANQMPVAIYSEFGRGILSDGVRLYIATDRGIRYVTDPASGLPAKTIHQEVGLMRQDTWKLVFHGGEQVGSIWLTPDRRVIANDFNTYGDIGRPIQTTLDAINVARARRIATATFVTDGQYELYMLAVPAPGIATVTANSGTSTAGTATTLTLAAGASAIDDAYNSYTLNITSGAASGLSSTITDYNGTTKVATVSPAFATTPSDTPTYTVKIPENDTLLVYDVVKHRWFTWYPADTLSANTGYGVFSQAYLQDIVNNRSLWLFATNNGGTLEGRVYRWHTGTDLATATNFRDRNSTGETPVTYDVDIITTWLDWGTPTVVKFLNDLEVITGDSGLTVAVDGANTAAQFASPTAVLAATAVTASPFGNYRVALAAATAQKFRFYRFTFNSPAGTTRDLLDFLRVEAVPLTSLI
jgi:hypothetical protein